MFDFSKRIFYPLPESSACSRSRHIYHAERGQQLPLDIYAPIARTATRPAPAVFLVHGGPIPPEMTPPIEWGIFHSYGELLATSGFAGVSFNHRLFDLADYERSRSDITAAVAYVRSRSDELHIDPDAMALFIFSGAGAHLNWLLAEPLAGLRCLVGFYPVLDVRPFLPPDADAALRSFVARFCTGLKDVGPAATRPMFIARAGLDRPDINAGIDAFVASVLARNLPFDLLNHAGGRHGFDYLDDDARTRTIIRAALDFLRAHVDDR